MTIIDKNLNKLNDFFRKKAEHDLERIEKVKEYMRNANTVINKIGDE
jgi:ferritin